MVIEKFFIFVDNDNTIISITLEKQTIDASSFSEYRLATLDRKRTLIFWNICLASGYKSPPPLPPKNK